MVTVYSHGQVAAKLVIEGALDLMAGKAAEKLPIEAVTLDEGRRAKLSCAPGGKTLYYEITPKSGVFMDLSGATTTVWFRDADGNDAFPTFEAMLRKSYPDAKQIEDKPGEKDETVRQRSYDVPLGGGRVAVVDVLYPAPGFAARSFFARIKAYATRDAQRN